MTPTQKEITFIADPYVLAILTQNYWLILKIKRLLLMPLPHEFMLSFVVVNHLEGEVTLATLGSQRDSMIVRALRPMFLKLFEKTGLSQVGFL